MLVAISIFTVAIMFILGTFPMAARSVHHARCYMCAGFIAQSRMDDVLAQPFATITDYIDHHGLPTSISVVSTNNGTQEAINFTISTTWSNPGSDANLLDVFTQVSWSEQTVTANQPIMNNVNVETLIANRPST